MKIHLTLKLDKSELPVDWRRTMLSFIKLILESELPETYEEYYGKGSTKMKPFTFWTLLNKPHFTFANIQLGKDEVALFVSTNNTKLAFGLYNGAKKFNGKFEIPNGNAFMVQRVKLEDEKVIKDNEIIVNMLSPLVVRKHFEEEKDRYFVYNEDGFLETFKGCVTAQIKNADKVPEITPIKCKMVVVKAYGAKIPASLGIFKLSGDVHTLNLLFQMGMSSKNGAGFGKFEVIG